MAKVNIYRIGKGYLRLNYSVWGVKYLHYLGITVEEKQWDEKAQRVKKHPHAITINAAIDRMVAAINDLHMRCRYDTVPFTHEAFKAACTQVWGDTKAKEDKKAKAKDLAQYILDLTAQRLASGELVANTARSTRLISSVLRRYKKDTGNSIEFGRIDLEFHAAFTEWMVQKNYANGYAHKAIKVIKQVLRYAADEGYTVSAQVNSPRFTVKLVESDTVFLTTEQLDKIENLDLTGQPGMASVRDAFLFACYTGLRFSDLQRVKADNLVQADGVRVLNLSTQKTGTAISVPILPRAEAILARNGGKMPAVPANQHMNRYLKTISKAAGLTTKQEVSRHKGGMRAQYNEPLYELVTVHTARRSFATNEYLLAVAEGRSIRPIMMILGHKSEKTFMRYIRIAQQENAMQFAKDRSRKVG